MGTLRQYKRHIFYTFSININDSGGPPQGHSLFICQECRLDTHALVIKIASTPSVIIIGISVASSFN